MFNVNTIIGIPWIIFVIYWFVSSLSVKKSSQKRRRRPFSLGVIIYIITIVLWNYFKLGDLYTFPLSIKYFGAGLCVFGIGSAIWARIYIGRNWGMPMSVKEEPELVTSGPYSFVRHPIYFGILTAMIGSFLVQGFFWIPILIVFGSYFIYSSRVEERLMLEQFPNQYPDYVKRTKSIIPFVY